MADRLLRHLLTVIGAVVTIAGFVSLLTSESVKTWVRSHSFWVFAAFIVSITIAFITVDYVMHRNHEEPTEHDRKLVARFLSDMPPDGTATIWLKQGTVYNGIPVEVLDVLDAVLEQMDSNMIGFDNRQVNEAYRQLEDAMQEFRSFVSLNLFMNRSFESMRLADQWPDEQVEKAANQLESLQASLVRAYDNFLRTCHRYRLD